MNSLVNQNNKLNNQLNKQDTLVDNIRILSDITRRDIEKSYNIDSTNGTEAYYSNRYGWILKRIVE